MANRSLNILQVGSGFPGWGGAELHLVNLSEQLTHRGHRVVVACRPGSFVEEQIRKRGLECVAARVRSQWNLKDAGAFRRLFRERRFDVVHVHGSADYVVSPTAARLAGVPVVVMSRHAPFPLRSALGRFLYEKVLFHRIIALSESVRQTLVGQGIAPSRVVTIHHGTDTEAFRRTTLAPEAVRLAWDTPAGAILVGLVGRIAPDKGVPTFLEALARLSAGGDGSQAAPIQGVIVGTGRLADTARAQAEALGLGKRVTFAGFREDVNNAIGALDVLVLASTWQEPCAAVVQQAMALAKPVVGTNLGGTPEMIVDGQTGLLVPPGDARALAEALRALAADPARRAAMGARGKDRVEALFTLSGMTDKIQALYYELWAEARGGTIEAIAPSRRGKVATR